MINYSLGVLSGIVFVNYKSEIMDLIVSSGLRDNIVAMLNGV
jgi:hypothetical protein|tara:strand:+ start:2722 stop:2847 length:126 start_codon:yes stop_codon:yes gene_type:complete